MSGTKISQGFSVESNVPLDSRTVVPDLASRDSIPFYKRFKGMKVFVESVEEYYYLKTGITNNDWSPLISASFITEEFNIIGFKSLPIISIDSSLKTILINYSGNDIQVGDCVVIENHPDNNGEFIVSSVTQVDPTQQEILVDDPDNLIVSNTVAGELTFGSLGVVTVSSDITKGVQVQCYSDRIITDNVIIKLPNFGNDITYKFSAPNKKNIKLIVQGEA
jgi:hypothetical protein